MKNILEKKNPLPAMLRLGKSVAPRMAMTRARASKLLNRSRVVTAIVVGTVIAALVTVPLLTPPIPWLPKANEAEVLLGTMLTAQAAITALTLAVTLFVMQGINNRPDTDDRMYREYIRRSWIRHIFWGSTLAVLVTGLTMLSESFIGLSEEMTATLAGIRNLTIVATFAFIANLGLVATLFERAIRMTHPEQWRSMRLEVNKQDVRDAVQAFIHRYHTAVASIESGNLDVTVAFPGPREGSANDAVEKLLDDARRAMTDRRLREFRNSIDAIRELVVSAMDEIERNGLEYGAPGSQPQWPPVWELSSNLYSLRQEVIHENSRDYLIEILRLDHWELETGLHRNSGELFTEGLDGYRRNYRIAISNGVSETREMLRDRIYYTARFLFFDQEPQKANDYLIEMVKHQERMLSDALDAGLQEDFRRLHEEFENFLQNIGAEWGSKYSHTTGSLELHRSLAQQYRITLMGLGGRAITLADAGRIADPDSYLDVSRRTYTHSSQLGDDVAKAMVHQGRSGFSIWSEWETEGIPNGRAYSISPGRYPLTFFSLRLMELPLNPVPVLDLQGYAQQVHEWFVNNSERLERFLPPDSDPIPTNRIEIATAALQSAIQRDVVTADLDIIQRELSEERIATFKSEVISASLPPNHIEQIFQRSDSYDHLRSDSEIKTEEYVIAKLINRGFMAETPEGARNRYTQITGDQWGRAILDDIIHQLCEAMRDAPLNEALMNTPETLLRAMDQAISDLVPENDMFMVMTGDWSDVIIGLRTEGAEGYQPSWEIPESHQDEIGRYLGKPIFIQRSQEERHLYLIDTKQWGHFVRKQFEGDQDLSIEVAAISEERARELLQENPLHFGKEPDEASKIRKLRTLVQVAVRTRTEFQVKDPTGARHIVEAKQVTRELRE